MYWPMWVIYLAYLICTMPLIVWRMATGEWYTSATELANRPYYIVNSVVSDQILAIPTFLFAVAAALVVFSYLYTGRNANMIHALPVNRKELFVTNYLSGLTFLVVPQLLVFVLTLLTCLANEITCIQYLFYGLMASLGVAFFAYSLAVFVAMFTGQLFAMPVFFYVANYLYVGCLYLINMIVSSVSYGIPDSWNPGKSCILSPMYYLNNNLRASIVYGTGAGADEAKGIEITGMHLVGIYAVVAIVLIFAAYQIYKRRHIETAGDWISIGIVKPIFRWGVALCGGILLSMFLVYTLSNGEDMVNAYGWIVVCMVVFGFICFFAAEMLLNKRFKVFNRKRMVEWMGFSVVAVLFLTLFRLDAFGIERRVPEKDDIKAAFVYMDYPLEVAPEELDEFLEMHREIIANKKAYLANAENEKGYYYTTICYYLKDGSKLERRYPLPITDEYRENPDSPSSKIIEWEYRTKNLKYQLFGRDYENNAYLSASIDLYSAEGDYKNYAFPTEDLNRLLEAINRDIDDGNLSEYYISCINGNSVSYVNEIWIDYRNYSSYYDNWDYYSRYDISQKKGIQEQEDMGYSSTGSYLRFGPNCVNIIEALEKLGITDDKWKLITSDEYDKIMQ